MGKPKIPSDFRKRLEDARLDSLALFRGLDQLDLTDEEIPQSLLHELFELDADYAEALWALEQPPHALDLGAMVRDTLDSLTRRSEVLEDLLSGIPARASGPLAEQRANIRTGLTVADACRDIPELEPSPN